MPPSYTPDYEIPGYGSSGGAGAPGTPVILVDGVLWDADLARSLLRIGAAEIDWKHTSYMAAIQLGVFGHWESEEAEEMEHKWRLVNDTENPGEKIWQLQSSTKDRFVIDSLGFTPNFGNSWRQNGGQQGFGLTGGQQAGAQNSQQNRVCPTRLTGFPAKPATAKGLAA